MVKTRGEKSDREVRRVCVSCLIDAGSEASMAMTKPRVWRAGEEGPGGERGGEILERTRIFPRVGIDWIMASRDFSCVSISILSGWGDWMGARVRGADGWCCVLCGRGGGPMVIGVVRPGPMKSGRGRDGCLWWPSPVKG